MVRNRNTRAVIAAAATILWVGYMVVGLAVINALMPTVEGEGPEGLAAFVGLVGGVFTMGAIMWWASD
jgi:hypothetical protein